MSTVLWTSLFLMEVYKENAFWNIFVAIPEVVCVVQHVVQHVADVRLTSCGHKQAGKPSASFTTNAGFALSIIAVEQKYLCSI